MRFMLRVSIPRPKQSLPNIAKKQKQELLAEAKTLKEQNTILRDKNASLQQEYLALQQEYHSLEETKTQALSLLDKLKLQLSEEEKERAKHFQGSLHWEERYKETQKVLELKPTQYMDSQTEAKLLASRLNDSQKALSETLAQNKLLHHDKWVLAQEKSQLEGQAKQMESAD